MKTIKETTIHELVIKNSKFITVLEKIDDSTNILNIVEEIKQQYPKATHYCYAYITENHQKSSDDGEPGGTAGMPMLNVLEKEQIVNVLAVTIRYFGGIKLGAGGLVRAYSKSVREALESSVVIELERGLKIEIVIPYDMQKNIDYLLKDSKVLEKDYQEQIKYIALISKNDLEKYDSYSYKILEEEYIEKIQ